jgi:hypothetical protein
MLFHTSCRQGFEDLVGADIFGRHSKFENPPNPIINYQVAGFHDMVSKRRDSLMTSNNRKLRLFLV